MDRDELMQLAAEKAIHEMSWESIEFLFKPATMLELLLRLDLAGVQQKIYEWVSDDGPDACPHRLRSEPYKLMLRAIEVEKFYRKLKTVRDNLLRSQPTNSEAR